MSDRPHWMTADTNMCHPLRRWCATQQPTTSHTFGGDQIGQQMLTLC